MWYDDIYTVHAAHLAKKLCLACLNLDVLLSSAPFQLFKGIKVLPWIRIPRLSTQYSNFWPNNDCYKLRRDLKLLSMNLILVKSTFVAMYLSTCLDCDQRGVQIRIRSPVCVIWLNIWLDTDFVLCKLWPVTVCKVLCELFWPGCWAGWTCGCCWWSAAVACTALWGSKIMSMIEVTLGWPSGFLRRPWIQGRPWKIGKFHKTENILELFWKMSGRSWKV